MSTATPRLSILISPGRAGSPALPGWAREMLDAKLRRAGLSPDEVPCVIADESAVAALNEMPSLNVIVPLDDAALRLVTGKTSTYKWHLSPLDAVPELTCRKVIPTFSPQTQLRQYELGVYIDLALKRAREESESHEYARKPKRFLLNPDLAETFEMLERLRTADTLSIDIETGRGQINTVGFAWSPSDAIAINVLPDRLSPENYYRLWRLLAELIEGPSRKVCQNGIYETLYFARYGIRLRNLWHDTMVAQKLLWPELDKDLGTVGRIYTREPYWKDSGRVATEEGGRRDWANVRDWDAHYNYNCSDTSGTLEAALAQRADLSARGLAPFFCDYLMPQHECLAEMCLRGLPLDLEEQARLVAEYEAKCADLVTGLSRPLNPKSWQQKLKLFREKGYKLPKKRNKAKDIFQESSDELSLKKLRLAHPEDTDIQRLLDYAKLSKALSSYLRVVPDPLDSQVRFSLGLNSTESGRWAGYSDPWDRGFNPQTIPKYGKKMIRFSSERIFVQVDLRQAESRFVAFDSCDTNLIGALTDPSRDIHSEVAAEIFGCPVAQVRAEHKAGNSAKRQLGKKSGHGANYSMGAVTFQNSCLKELDLVLTKDEAGRTLNAYHTLFPGITRWHARIRETLRRERRLTNPLGRVRYFYGRMDDNTFRESYAYRPQSTVPDIISHLMLRLAVARADGDLSFWFHLQAHDSLTLSCVPGKEHDIAEFCFKTEGWHPEVILPAGRLIIPTSVEVGSCMGKLEEYERR